MAAWVTWRKDLSNFGQVLWGSVLAPLSNAVDFIKGSVVFLYHRFKGTPYAVRSNPVHVLTNDKADIKARTTPFTSGLGRIGGIIATTLYILGFIGALVLPIPGVAPIYAISTAAIAKACGITILSTMIGRGIGALVGSIIDVFYDKPIRDILLKNTSTTQIKPLATVPVGKLEFIFKATVTTCLFGDEAIFPALLHKHLELFNKEQTLAHQHAMSFVSPVIAPYPSMRRFSSSISQTNSDYEETSPSLLKKNSFLNNTNNLVELSLINEQEDKAPVKKPTDSRLKKLKSIIRIIPPLPTRTGPAPDPNLLEATLSTAKLLELHPIDDQTPLSARSTSSSVSSNESEGVPMHISPQSKQASPINTETTSPTFLERAPSPIPPNSKQSSVDMPIRPLASTPPQMGLFSTLKTPDKVDSHPKRRNQPINLQLPPSVPLKQLRAAAFPPIKEMPETTQEVRLSQVASKRKA